MPPRRHAAARNAHWAAFSAACIVLYGLSVRAAAGRGADPLGALWSLSQTPGALVDLGALAGGRVWVDGQWWRVLSAGLLHGSLVHLAVNLWSLWSVAPPLDRVLGRLGSSLVFVTGVAAGSLASLAFGRGAVVVGASAGIVAQAGALWVVRRFGPPSLWRPAADVSPRALFVSLALLVAVGFAVPVIAQAGHLGGLLAGCAMAGAAVRARRRRLALAAAAVVSLVPLSALAYAPAWSAAYHEQVGVRALDLGQVERARAAFDRALSLAPDDPRLQNAVAYALALAGRDLDRAEALARAALAADPSNADVWDTLGWALCRAGRTDEGLAALHEARDRADAVFPELREHLEGCAGAAVHGR